ncbi:MAG: helix-turn-helix transcriptional regulator [Eubacteriales bacterium]|nr:helix-turn-helix transcriptional regulator [Eubacteriales bacterium]
MDNFQFELGTRLRRFRIIKDYSIEELSHKAGLNPSHLGKIERGERNFTIMTLNKIVEALDIPYYQLFDSQMDEEILTETNPLIEKTLSYLNTMTTEEQRHIYKTVQMLSEKK